MNAGRIASLALKVIAVIIGLAIIFTILAVVLFAPRPGLWLGG